MRSVGAVVFDGFEMLDLYGPLEIFCMHRDALEIHSVGQTAGPKTASGGPATLAQDGFGDDRVYDILLVPGGAGTRIEVDNPAMLDWLAKAGQRAEIVASVCSGSLLLARAGLLEGRRATTNKQAFDWVANQTQGVDWQRRARWIEDGKFWTASGVSAGMDMSLGLVNHLLGAKAAADAAMWAEYTWNRDPNNDPFSVEET